MLYIIAGNIKQNDNLLTVHWRVNVPDNISTNYSEYHTGSHNVTCSGPIPSTGEYLRSPSDVPVQSPLPVHNLASCSSCYPVAASRRQGRDLCLRPVPNNRDGSSSKSRRFLLVLFFLKEKDRKFLSTDGVRGEVPHYPRAPGEQQI